MEQLQFEEVVHEQEGQAITYVMQAGSDDWFCNILRKRPHANPAWYHLHRCKLTEGRLLRYADIGANIGTTALLPACVGHRVLAVEAGPLNVALLTRAVQRNRLQAQVQVAHWAAAEGFGMARFHEAGAWGSTVISPTHAALATESLVPAAALVDILEMTGFDGVDLVKIDIEGAEMAALSGFERLAQRNLALELIVETNWETCALHGHAPQAVWALGFSVYVLAGKRLTPVGPNLPQPRFVTDVLATRRPKEALKRLGYELVPMDFTALPEALAQTQVGDRDPEVVRAFIDAQMARLP
ncbi:MAG: FkbM family methyltransferase [Flavobacteriaceae bacterium]|nr:FkbM family methyltransferase [Flavobacteriaceae bacterium]